MDGIKGWVSEGHVLKHKPTNHMYLGCYHRVEEIPENAIHADGIVGQDLITGMLFVTSEALKGDLKRLDEVDIIIIPRGR